MAVTVDLELDHFCIQTAARREHARLLRRLLEAQDEDGVVMARVDLLAEFLAGTDFRRLRAEQPALAGGEVCRVTIARTPTGEPRWYLSDRSDVRGGEL